MKEDVLKQELIRWLEKLEDRRMLETLLFFKDISRKEDWWDELTEEQKQLVLEGQKQADAGMLITAEEVWEKYGKILKDKLD